MLLASAARWSVVWVVKKKGKIRLVTKDFEDDLVSALELYEKAKAAGKPFATLISRNMAFAPPKRLRPYDTTVRVRNERGKIVRRTEHMVPMATLNADGKYWCPYCMKLRKFQRYSGFRSQGHWVAEANFSCPICGISHRNHWVRYWNPEIARMPHDLTVPRTRRSNGSGSRRRARR